MKSHINYRQFFYLRSKGYNNKDIAEKLGVSHTAILRRCKLLRDMDDVLFKKFWEDYVK